MHLEVSFLVLHSFLNPKRILNTKRPGQWLVVRTFQPLANLPSSSIKGLEQGSWVENGWVGGCVQTDDVILSFPILIPPLPPTTHTGWEPILNQSLEELILIHRSAKRRAKGQLCTTQSKANPKVMSRLYTDMGLYLGLALLICKRLGK